MARSGIDLAKSTGERLGCPRAGGPRCEYLYADSETAQKAYSIPIHQHEFWQLEVALAAGLTVRLEDRNLELPPGSCLLLPPQVSHGFHYRPGCRYLSVKFRSALPAGSWWITDLLAATRSKTLLAALAALFGQSSPPPSGTEGVLEALLSGILETCLQEQTGMPRSVPLALKVRDFLQQQGGAYVSVAQVAKHLNLSASRASARFREETGEALKAFVDRERGAAARQLVVFSDLDLKQIAFRLGFNDLFGFSRFFKRLHGTSPRGLRAEARRRGGPVRPGSGGEQGPSGRPT